METKQLIEKILTSTKVEDIISVTDFNKEFNAIIKEIHPDICSLDGAVQATIQMNKWKNHFENGSVYKDDVCEIKTNYYWAEFTPTSKNLNWSIENYRLFKQLKSDTDIHFQKYLPSEGKLLSDGTFRFEFDKRAIPLSGLTLSQEHVNWILNRLLEYCAYLSEIDFVHCGLNPESVFIVPETHGIQICSFYHLTRVNNKVGTVSGKYKNWYPHELFTDKIATPLIDLECSKKIAAYLLGDKSGSGVKFKKTHNEDFINFIVSQHDGAYKCLTDYKELLRKNFKKQFHILTV